MAPQIPKRGEPWIGEKTTEEVIVPVATAVTGGFGAYVISEEYPELVGLGTAAAAAWWIAR